MSILGDVAKELFKMFVADMRLTLAILIGLGVIAALIRAGLAGPLGAAGLIVALALAVLAETVLREARTRKG